MRLSVESKSGKSVLASRLRGDSSISFPVVSFVLERGIDEDVKSSAVLEHHAFAHLLGGAESLAQAPMHFARIRAARCGFGFKTIELLQHFDRHPDDILLKLEHRLRVVNEDVGVEDVVLRGREVGFFDGHGFWVFQERGHINGER